MAFSSDKPVPPGMALHQDFLEHKKYPIATKCYETLVKYWMRVTYSGVGFHDATWQSSFGGNVYTYRGSHGCINMSYSDAGKLYELIQVGDPVIMHY